MNIFLLKTPFDATYKNVVDFIHYEGASKDNNYNQTLADTLIGSFSTDRLDIINIDNRAFKRSADLTSITIKYNYDVVRDYNYVIIFKNSKFYFYFINNIVSNNDNPENPSCTLTLEWDVWNNNIDEITKNNSYNVVEMAHFDRFKLDEDGVELLPKFIKLNKQDVTTTKTPFVPDNLRYIPVFRVFQMTNFPSYSDVKDDTELSKVFSVNLPLTSSEHPSAKLTILDSLSGKYDRNLIYSVVGVFDVVTETYLSNIIVSSESREMTLGLPSASVTPLPSGGIVVDVTSNQQDINLSSASPEDWYIPNRIRAYIESSYLSFQCPFDYEFSFNTKKLVFKTNPIVNARSKLAKCVVLGDFYLTEESTTVAEDPAFNTFSPNRIYNKSSMRVNYYKNTNFANLLNPVFFRRNTAYTKSLDPQAFMYPYSYYTIVYGNEEIVMEPITEDDYSFVIDKSIRTAQTQFEVSSNDGERIVSPTNIFVDMPVPYSLGILAETSYMVRNGTQLNTSKSLNKFATYMELGRLAGNMSVITSGYASSRLRKQKKNEAISRVDKIGSLMAEELKINAFEKDLVNTPGSWYPSMGECDILYQDRVRVIHNEVDYDNPAFNEFLDLIYYYGYERTRTINILDNTRIYFDYCQTSNCDLCELKINNYDKEMIEDIFNRGVTKWHILYNFDDDTLVNFTIPTKDKTVLGNNIEHKFETNPTYKNWANT